MANNMNKIFKVDDIYTLTTYYIKFADYDESLITSLILNNDDFLRKVEDCYTLTEKLHYLILNGFQFITFYVDGIIDRLYERKPLPTLVDTDGCKYVFEKDVRRCVQLVKEFWDEEDNIEN